MHFRTPSMPAPEINLIAFIDILLVIIIFLVLTSAYQQYQYIPLTLTAHENAANDLTLPPETLDIYIVNPGNLKINGQLVPLTSQPLFPVLAKIPTLVQPDNAQRTVVIHADQRSDLQWSLRLLATLQNLGFENIVFSTKYQTGPK